MKVTDRDIPDLNRPTWCASLGDATIGGQM
jgi:hypothetical protein